MWSKPYIVELPNSCEEVCVCVCVCLCVCVYAKVVVGRLVVGVGEIMLYIQW